MSNNNFIQLIGPFQQDTNLLSELGDIKHIGIQSEEGHEFRINNEAFKIGKTGILEFDDTKINSLYCLQNEKNTTIIDCILND